MSEETIGHGMTEADVQEWRRKITPAQSSAESLDPADLWERYCAETPREGRSPQGAMAFAVDALTGDAAQPTGVLGRENDAFHRALRKYPDAFEALHSFWNDAFTSQPSPAATVETKRTPLDLTTTELNQLATEAFGEAAAQSRCSAGTERDALGYAQRLATALWEKHWKSDAPDWKPLPDLVGVLTQIDNATAGLIRSGPQTALEILVREYARDLRRNSGGGDDYPWKWAKATADYLETLIERSQGARK